MYRTVLTFDNDVDVDGSVAGVVAGVARVNSGLISGY